MNSSPGPIDTVAGWATVALCDASCRVAVSDLVAKARAFYGDVGLRADHLDSASAGAYFDRFWTAQGRRPEHDAPEERLGYRLARHDYVGGCLAYRGQQKASPVAVAPVRAEGRTGARRRGAGRPRARSIARGGDSGDSDGLADPDSEPPGVARLYGRALRRARAPPLSWSRFQPHSGGPLCIGLRPAAPRPLRGGLPDEE